MNPSLPLPQRIHHVPKGTGWHRTNSAVSHTTKRRRACERDTLGPMPAQVPSAAMLLLVHAPQRNVKSFVCEGDYKFATSALTSDDFGPHKRRQAMIAVTWLVLAGCVVLALVFAIAADCVAASGPQRDEGRLSCHSIHPCALLQIAKYSMLTFCGCHR